MVPEIKRQEWRDLIKGKNTQSLSSFSLQMKVNSLKLFCESGKMSMDDAVKELYETCAKYEKIYETDLRKIFR